MEKLTPGFTRFPDNLFDQSLRTLPPGEFKLYSAIVRLTLGFNVESKAISVPKLTELTGLSEREVRYLLGKLSAKHAIWIQHRTRKPSIIGVVMRPENWTLSLQPIAPSGCNPLQGTRVQPIAPST